uniref:hypothetical protein n=1 Tax=Pararhizobium sp. IMCC3301 TaxID=3067904 RepID=UPI002740DCDB|nr:hypothetical protein [Pararhizobium sp. IMCC3301]
MTRRQLNILIPVVSIAILMGIVWGWLAGNTGKIIYVLTPTDLEDPVRVEQLVTGPMKDNLKTSGDVGRITGVSIAGLSAIAAEPAGFAVSIDSLTRELTTLASSQITEDPPLRPSVIGVDRNDIIHVFRIYNDVSDERLMISAADLLIRELKTLNLRVFANPQNAESAADEQTYVALGAVPEEAFSEMIEGIQNRIPPEIYLSAYYEISGRF